MKKLIKLEDFNREAALLYNDSGRPCLNGIACPNCGEELYDTNPNCTFTSNPPQKSTGCNSCGYSGLRVR